MYRSAISRVATISYELRAVKYCCVTTIDTLYHKHTTGVSKQHVRIDSAPVFVLRTDVEIRLSLWRQKYSFSRFDGFHVSLKQ